MRSSELLTWIEQQSARGLHIQLSFDAFYSGRFSQAVSGLRQRLKSQHRVNAGQFCATSSQDARKSGYISDSLLTAGYSQAYFPALRRYGNQLSASACAAGSDMLNDPTSSLEEYVRAKLAQRQVTPTPVQELVGECSGALFARYAQPEINRTVESLQKSVLQLKAELLFNDFKRYWVDPLQECWQNRQSELAFARKVNSCLPEAQELTDVTRRHLTDAMGRALEGAQNDMADLQVFSAFFRDPHLSDEDLENFKDEFCCLARDLRTGEQPQSCRTTATSRASASPPASGQATR